MPVKLSISHSDPDILEGRSADCLALLHNLLNSNRV
jgi:hypothetical protein